MFMKMYQWKSITNCLFQWHKRNVRWTWTACCLTCHMNWTIFPRTPSESMQWTYLLLMTSFFSLWHDHPGKFVLTLLKCYNFTLPKLFAVTCDSRRHSGSVHISLVSMKQTISYWLSLKQNTLEQLLYPNLVHFHAQNFIWWCFQIL